MKTYKDDLFLSNHWTVLKVRIIIYKYGVFNLQNELLSVTHIFPTKESFLRSNLMQQFSAQNPEQIEKTNRTVTHKSISLK